MSLEGSKQCCYEREASSVVMHLHKKEVNLGTLIIFFIGGTLIIFFRVSILSRNRTNSNGKSDSMKLLGA